MKHAISRTRFLRGDFSGRRAPLRPPWSLAEMAFAGRCTRCEDCLRACPEGILVRGAGGFPEVDFRRGECTFCHACAASCPTGAIADAGGTEAWGLMPGIDPQRCLAWQGVVCVTCQEQCETAAIRLSLRPGGVARPEVAAGACTGCGACVRPCPGEAIRLQARESIPSSRLQEVHP